jgi:hypothetical protein
MPTPLYVIRALAEVRTSGLTNMLDRDAVEMLVLDQRAAEWINKATNAQYFEALNDMSAAESDDWVPEESDGSDTFFAADYNSDVDEADE